MAKKLIFQKSGGNNISIDEEGLTANLWTEATFSDFGRYTPVFFGNLLYINLTGTFTTANPATDTTNWREIGTGSSSGNIQTITVNDGTGIVTITYNDGTATETFNAGHQISVDGVAQPFQPTVDFHGNISEENDTTDNSTNLYFPLVANSTGTGETILDTTGSGGSDGKQPLETIKRIAGTADEIDVAAGTTSTPITVSLNSKIKNEFASLIGPTGKLGNIGNVTIENLQDGQIIKSDGGIWKNVTDSSVGHEISHDGDTPRPDQPILNFVGDINVVNNTTDNRTDVYGIEIKPGIVPGAVNVPLVVEAGLDNNSPVIVIRNLTGEDDIVITEGTGNTVSTSTAVKIGAPNIAVNKASIDTLVGATGTINNINDVTVSTDVRNQDILEYNLVSKEWVNRTLPNGLVERLEDLEDVEIIGDEDNKILIARAKAAYFQVNPTSIGDTIYSIDTSGGLMFTKPGGSTPLITSVAVAFATSRSDITNYLIIDETGGDQLMVSIEFAAASITIEQFIDRIVLALQTDWADGTGDSTERTVTDQMAGNVLVGMNGTWSKAANPDFIEGERASGTTPEYFMPSGAPPINDAVAIRWHISGRPTGYIQGVTDTFTGLGNTPTIIELLDTGVAALNDPTNPGGFNQDFPPNYLATRVGNAIRVVATGDGAQSNGLLTLEFVDNASRASNASDYIRSIGTTTITGGISGSGQPFSFRWTDSSHKHIIARPTLEAGGSATTTFSQGGFAWIDELPTLNLLSDVNINLPQPVNSLPLQMIKSDFSGNWSNTEARIENLNVNRLEGALTQGSLIQYYPAGVGEWEYVGLRDDGMGNFNQVPFDGQFLTWNDFGGNNSRWEAITPVLNSLSDVDTVTKVPIAGDTLRFDGTNWVPILENVAAVAYFGLPTSTQNVDPNATSGALGLLALAPSHNFEVPDDRTSIKILNAGLYGFFGKMDMFIETGTTGGTVLLTLDVIRNGSVITQFASDSATLGDGTTDPTVANLSFSTIGEFELLVDDLIQIRFTSTPAFAWEYAAIQGSIDLITLTRLDNGL